MEVMLGLWIKKLKVDIQCIRILNAGYVQRSSYVEPIARIIPRHRYYPPFLRLHLRLHCYQAPLYPLTAFACPSCIIRCLVQKVVGRICITRENV